MRNRIPSFNNRLLHLIIWLIITNSVSAQLINNGATIKISPGATLMCSGNFTNSAGTIDNDGIIEIQGNFSNSGTYISTLSSDVLVLSGTGNVTFKGGNSIYNSIVINKTNNGGVTLTGNLNINNNFAFTSGSFSTDVSNSYSLIAPVSATFSFVPGLEINGRVKRTGWTHGSSIIFNSPNTAVQTNGGTAPTSILVSMIAGGDPTGNEREVKRKFTFEPTGGSNYTVDVSMPYVASELNGNVEANLVPWFYSASEWTAKLNNNTVNTTSKSINSTGIDATSFSNNEWKLADSRYSFDVTAFLKGAWNNTAGLMRTNLNGDNLLPLIQPYNGAPTNYNGTESVTAIPNTQVVDWVLLELRKPATGLPEDADTTTIIGRKAVFLLSNGKIVDLDGISSPSFEISKQGPSFIVIKHRNHLAVMSKSLSSNASGTFTNNFSLLANIYRNPGASSDPAALLASTGAGIALYGLWPGDVNRNGSVTSSDVSPINVAIAGPASGNSSVYDVRDTNLDRNVTSADVSITNTSLSGTAQASASRGISRSNNRGKEIKTHVPGNN